MSLVMTVVMQLELILKYCKTAFKDLVFTRLGLQSFKYFYRWPCGWLGGLSETGNKSQLKLKLS